MRGVQFLTDSQGHKTAALLDLREHRQLWANVSAADRNTVDLQFLRDENGEQVAVLLVFEKHGEFWENIYDVLTIESRVNEPRVSQAEVQRELALLQS